MKHEHAFEIMSRPEPSQKASAIGIMSIELMRCDGCGLIVPYIHTHDGWFPLCVEDTGSEKDILLA